ncbi:DUF5017 domain-containing protein [Sphingobacterium hotanense]|uniref:DUF5017 domain-containing protein n=1 Tax=Sphingobacterium hotanense TaxID=649196 RepID=UPI0021A55ADA|nr:DUF5017 domain-containing protein [Sphingobacterium hotanense]MCT1524507.1 DUF5017 domain-containing protein [Sphingobacterium hotanense]
MKYYTIIYRLLIIMGVGLLTLQGCKKESSDIEETETPGEFKMVGYAVEDGVDTEGNPKKRVNFQLSGTQGLNISFFSGDIAGNYEYRDGRVQKLEELNLSFESNCSYGDQGCDLDIFSIMASTDFNGGDQEADIRAATWVNITDRFTISPFESGTSVYHESGSKNLADLTVEGQPLYLAARHITHNQIVDGALANVYTAFRVRNWNMTGSMEGMEPVVLSTTIGEAGFRFVEIGNFRAGRNALNASLITLRGNHGTAADNLEYLDTMTECWAIAAPITMADVSFEPDRPLRVKQSHQPPVKTFAFNYNGPGEYHAVFVLSKDDGGESVTKEVTINIPE